MMLRMVKGVVYFMVACGGVGLLHPQPALGQTCNFTSIRRSTPVGTFENNGDGTVTDTRHGLVWKRCAEGQSWSGSTCTGTATTHTWSAALTLAAAAEFAGSTDWRLPNIKELASIVEEACYGPAIDSGIFPNTPTSYFWASSPSANDTGYAWVVGFSYGYDDNGSRNGSTLVRLVRAGQ